MALCGGCYCAGCFCIGTCSVAAISPLKDLIGGSRQRHISRFCVRRHAACSAFTHFCPCPLQCHPDKHPDDPEAKSKFQVSKAADPATEACRLRSSCTGCLLSTSCNPTQRVEACRCHAWVATSLVPFPLLSFSLSPIGAGQCIPGAKQPSSPPKLPPFLSPTTGAGQCLPGVERS